MNLRTPLILVLFSLNINLYSQNIVFKTYTVNDGMVANPVRRVIQDSKGFIWIATWEGLSKYDGNKFTNYRATNGLSFDLINDMYEDASGKIYLAENNGSIDLIDQDHIARDSIHKDVVVNHFFPANGNKVYAGTDNQGILEFEHSRWNISRPQAFNVIIDFAEINDSLRLIVNSNFRPFVVDRDLKIYSAASIGRAIASAIRFDSENRIWLCTSAGLRLLSRTQKKNEPISFDPLPSQFSALAGVEVFDFFEDRDGNFWISTLNGLVRINRNGRGQTFTTRNGLPTNLVSNFYQDREKNIWMCSQAGLVKIVMKNNLQYFEKEDGLQTDEVLSIVSGKKLMYLLNGSRILSINAGNNELTPVFEDPGKAGFSSLILDSKDSITTLLTSQTLYRKESPRKALLKTDSNDYFFCQAMDTAGNYFVGGSNGLTIRTAKNVLHAKELPLRITGLLFDDQGYLWTGTWSDGLYRLKIQYNSDGVGIETENLSRFLKDKSIRSIFIDHSENIWIGTRYQGVFRLKHQGKENFEVTNFSQKTGLNSNWVKAIAEDNMGNVWIGTLQGLNKLIPVQDSFRIFDFSGINHFYGAVNCISPGADAIWCGGPSGLVRFKDEQLDTMKAPEVFLTAIQSNAPVTVRDEGTASSKSFPYNSNHLNIEFSAPSFINEKEVLYSYQLKGSRDTSWSIPTNFHSVAYASLTPGHYQFEIRALGWNGSPGKATIFAFIIEKPFWQTWWFYALAALVLMGMVYALYRYRINQLIALQRVRNRIATDLHDDIGSSLTNINILSELSSQNLNSPDHAKKFLQRIAEEVGNTSQAMDDIIWNVNSENDSVRETLERMRRFAAELFDHSAVQYHIELDEAVHGKKMNMEQRRDIFLMYKEMLNNVYKHSAAQEVWILVKLKGNNLVLDIKDNGKGFDTTMVTHRNGLKNLYQRSARWNGTIDVHSEAGKGAAVHISLPLSG